MASVEDARVRAERTYKVLLERFPGNPRLVRAYARFLADVRCDAAAASRRHREADRLERAEDALVAAAAEEQAALDEQAMQARTDEWDAENTAEAEGAASAWAQRGGPGAASGKSGPIAALDAPPGGGGGGNDKGAAVGAAPLLPPFLRQVSDRAHGIIVINAFGTIQMLNRTALRVFGYKKGELDGKNVAVMMPQPFAARHNGFLRNTMTTGRTVFLNKVIMSVGLHRDRYIIPMRQGVVKVAGAGADALYLSAIAPLRESRGFFLGCFLFFVPAFLFRGASGSRAGRFGREGRKAGRSGGMGARRSVVFSLTTRAPPPAPPRPPKNPTKTKNQQPRTPGACASTAPPRAASSPPTAPSPRGSGATRPSSWGATCRTWRPRATRLRARRSRG
jgi:PAS domain-containing protein